MANNQSAHLVLTFEKAMEAEKNGDLATALYSYRYLAEEGEVNAVQKLAILCWEGIMVEKNLEESIRWFRRGVRANDLFCIFNLARCYMNGIGVPKNDGLAIEFLLKAANLGDSDSSLVLAKHYWADQHDWDLCLHFLRHALERENVYAFTYLEVLREELEEQISGIVSEQKEERLQKIIKARKENWNEIQRRLRNATRDVFAIFMEKKIDNKVHWIRFTR